MASSHSVVGSSANWATEVEQSSVPVVVDFWAEWCGPCKMLSPVLDEIGGELEGRAKVVKVDIESDDNRELAAKYGVRAIPALFFFKDGQLVDQLSGAQPKSVIKSKLEALA